MESLDGEINDKINDKVMQTRKRKSSHDSGDLSSCLNSRSGSFDDSDALNNSPHSPSSSPITGNDHMSMTQAAGSASNNNAGGKSSPRGELSPASPHSHSMPPRIGTSSSDGTMVHGSLFHTHSPSSTTSPMSNNGPMLTDTTTDAAADAASSYGGSNGAFFDSDSGFSANNTSPIRKHTSLLVKGAQSPKEMEAALTLLEYSPRKKKHIQSLSLNVTTCNNPPLLCIDEEDFNTSKVPSSSVTSSSVSISNRSGSPSSMNTGGYLPSIDPRPGSPISPYSEEVDGSSERHPVVSPTKTSENLQTSLAVL